MSVTLEGPDGRGPFGHAHPQQQHQPQATPQHQPTPPQAPAAPASVPHHPPPIVSTPAPQTASQRIVSDANAINRVTDARGRVLGWRKLDALDDFDLSEIAGGQNVANAKWMVYATIAFAVREIDGQPVGKPLNRAQLRARIQQLGAEGIDAVYQELVPPMPAEPDDPLAPAEAPPDPTERAKNSQGTLG